VVVVAVVSSVIVVRSVATVNIVAGGVAIEAVSADVTVDDVVAVEVAAVADVADVLVVAPEVIGAVILVVPDGATLSSSQQHNLSRSKMKPQLNNPIIIIGINIIKIIVQTNIKQ